LAAASYVLIALPVALLTFAWRAWMASQAPSTWRKKTTLVALIVESIGAAGMPTLFLALETHTWARWIDRNEISAMNYASLTGVVASILAIPLAAFAWGKIRWLMLPVCLLTLSLSFLAGMAMSY
jgi:hypothetical protein